MFGIPEKKSQEFRVGDHVRVKYRGQEGTVIDINGKLQTIKCTLLLKL